MDPGGRPASAGSAVRALARATVEVAVQSEVGARADERKGNAGRAQVGHHDRMGQGDAAGSWNSAHLSRGCSQQDLQSTGGAGLFYCFAID